LKRVQRSEPLNTKNASNPPDCLDHVLYTHKLQSFLPNRAPKMQERQQLFFGLRLVSEEFQHHEIQTKIVQSFGGFFHQIKVQANRKKGFYTNLDPNKQEVGFIFMYEAAQNFEVLSNIQN
jgi:hypothetical protein